MADPIIPWIGGKRRLLKHLLPVVPEHLCYVEAFSGAAALFFAKQPSQVEVINDINFDLVRLYRCVEHHMDELVRQFRWALTSRKMFEWAQETPPDTLTDVQRAARFFYLQHLAFGARVDKQTFGTATTAKSGLNLLRVEEQLSAAHLRLNNVAVECLDWQRLVERYDRPHTFFFLDPPYLGTQGYGGQFGAEQYECMAAWMRRCKGKVLLTVNDVPKMREAFVGMRTTRVSIAYTVGRSAASRTQRGELIIRNW
jgi:DNA adenine methylase